MNSIVMNGASKVHPSTFAICWSFASFSATTYPSSLLMSPAIGSSRKSLASSLTTAIPPWLSMTMFTAFAIISESCPIVMILCESWEMDAAMAPFLRPKPWMNALETLSWPYLSTTDIFSTSWKMSDRTIPSWTFSFAVIFLVNSSPL